MRTTVIQRIDALRTPAAAGVVGLLLGVVATLDLVTGEEISFSLFYLVPVVVVTFRWRGRSGQGAAVAGVIREPEHVEPMALGGEGILAHQQGREVVMDRRFDGLRDA